MSSIIKKAREYISGSPKKGKGTSSKGGKDDGTKRKDATKGGKNNRSAKGAGMPKGKGKGKKAEGSSVGNENNSTKRNSRKDPFLNFGPILESFLSNEKLGKKSISAVYTQDTQSWEIDFTFSTLDGIYWSEPITLDRDEFMNQKDNLLGVTPKSTKYVAFVQKLLTRCFLDVTKSVPAGPPNLAIEFLSKHLSPLERTLVNLSDQEWNTIDSDKLSKAINAYKPKVDTYYGGRAKYLTEHISGLNKTKMDPYDWIEAGYYSVTKQTLLKDFQVRNVMTNDDEIKIRSMIEQIANLEGDGEESKTGTGA